MANKNIINIRKKLDKLDNQFLNIIKKRTFLAYSLKLMREALVSSIDESLSRISDDEMSLLEMLE